MYLVTSRNQFENLTQVRVKNPEIESNFHTIFQGQQMHISMRFDARNTMVFLVFRYLCGIRS